MTTTIIEDNSHLSKGEFTQRLVLYLQHVIRKYNNMDGRERMKNVLLDIERYARYNDEEGISVTYGWTAYAVRWSQETLRLNIPVEHVLESMKVREIIQLIHELHTACPTQIDVSHYLNDRYGKEA